MDLKTLKLHRSQFKKQSDQIKHLLTRRCDLRRFSAVQLSEHLKGLDLPQVADRLLEKNITGKAFLDGLLMEDLENIIGNKDPVTINRVVDVQKSMTGHDATAEDEQIKKLVKSFQLLFEQLRTDVEGIKDKVLRYTQM